MAFDIPECVNLVQGDVVLAHVRAVQASMERAASDDFSESELEHLRAVTRLAVEIYHYFQLTCAHSFCLMYQSESVFSGIDSYCIVTQAYRMLAGARESQIKWDAISAPELKVRFTSLFDGLAAERAFESRCRCLLDLYKLMIVFAGISYDG